MDRQPRRWVSPAARSILATALLFLTLAFAALVLAAPQPAKLSQGISIVSVKNGMWNDPATWSPAQVPGNNDTVTINHNVTLDTNTPIPIGYLQVIGALTGICDVQVHATAGLRNDGLIQAGTAGDHGCNVILQSTGGSIENYGVLQGGEAPYYCLDMQRYGTEGGDVTLNAQEIYNYSVIAGGRGNQEGCLFGGGHGGDVSITSVYTLSHVGGILRGGLGGNSADTVCAGSGCIPNPVCAPGSSGDVYVFGTPTLLEGGLIESAGPGTCQGEVIIEPPNILLTGDLVIEGATISIFSPANWTITISGTITGTPILSATQSITLTTASGGAIDLTGITTETEVFRVVSGTMSIQSDVITSTVPITEMADANTTIITAPSVNIYQVTIPSISRAYQRVKARDVFTLSVRVQNTGNVTDTYTMRFYTQDSAWNLMPDQAFTRTLGVFKDTTLPVVVTVPDDFEGGTNVISFTINSAQTFASAATVISGCILIQPEVSFAYAPEVIKVGKSITFQVTPATGNWSYIWDFGDGQFGSSAQAIHSFESEGVFSVTLQIANDCDTRSITRQVMVSLYRIYLPVVLRGNKTYS